MVNRHDLVARNADEATASPPAGGAGGTRAPTGWPGRLAAMLAFAWVAFLLHSETGLSFWLHDNLASPLSDLTGWQLRFVSAHADIKVVHLVFALALATLTCPLVRTSPHAVVPLYDWVLILLTVCAAAYLVAFRYDIEARIGLLLRTDFLAGITGLIVLCFAVYRTLGLPMFLIAGGFMLFACLGNSSMAPGAAQWDIDAAATALRAFWLEADGVFGRTLEITVALIFPLALLGAFLDKAGARAYFTDVATACFGHMRGGPEKAAVAATVLSGLYAPSARTDTAGCLPVTAPLMQHTGRGRLSAVSIQQAASAHGQVVPPVMGAAAFLIADRAGVGVGELARHLIAPATIALGALLAFVHIDAVKKNLRGLARQPGSAGGIASKAFWLGMLVSIGAATFGIGPLNAWAKTADLKESVVVLIGICAFFYLVTLWIAARRPDMERPEPDMHPADLAPVGAVTATGLYFFLPLAAVIWLVTAGELTATASLLITALGAAVVAVSHHSLKALFRGQFDYVVIAAGRGARAVAGGIVAAARVMAVVVVAGAAAGVVLSSAVILGLEPVLGEVLDTLSSINFMFGLVGAALLCWVFGAGMPTAVGYLLAAVLVAPVVISMCLAAGYEVTLLAVHFFALFFVAAAGHPKLSSARIGLVVLPFMFFVNPDLLLIDVALLRAPLVVAMALLGAVVFAALCQRHLIARTRLWETLVLAGVAFTLLHPGYWLDRLQSPFREIAPAGIFSTASTLPENAVISLTVTGPVIGDDAETKSITVPVALGAPGTGARRLEAAGLIVFLDGVKAVLEAPFPGTPHADLSSRFDFSGDRRVEITSILLPAEGRWPKDLFYLPALALLLIVYLVQRRRRGA